MDVKVLQNPSSNSRGFSDVKPCVLVGRGFSGMDSYIKYHIFKSLKQKKIMVTSKKPENFGQNVKLKIRISILF